jgi:hypothetical protein
MDTVVLSRGKASGGWRLKPIPFNAEVKESAELYIYNCRHLYDVLM